MKRAAMLEFAEMFDLLVQYATERLPADLRDGTFHVMRYVSNRKKARKYCDFLLRWGMEEKNRQEWQINDGFRPFTPDEGR